MATKRSSSNDEGDLSQGEEDVRSVSSEAKLPRLRSSDGGKRAEIVATDQEPQKDQEPQAAVAGKRSNCGSIKEQDEEDTDSGVSEAKKRKVVDASEGAVAEEAIQDATGTEGSTDISWQALRDGKESTKEEEGSEQRDNGEVGSPGEQKENNKEEQEVGMEELPITERDQLQNVTSAAIVFAGLAEYQEGRAGQDEEGGEYGGEVVVQTGGGGYAWEEVVENDAGEENTKDPGREDEGNANANEEDTVDEGEQHANEQEKKEGESDTKRSNEGEAEGRAGQDEEGGEYGGEVVVQTDGGGYAWEEVVENDAGEQNTKDPGREDEGNANANEEDTVDEGEEHANEQEKKEGESDTKSSDEGEAREEEEHGTTEQRKEEGIESEEDDKAKDAEKEGDDESGALGDKAEKADEKESGEEDKDKAKNKTDEEDPVPLLVTYSKETHVITLPLTAEISTLKEEISERTGVQPEMQKLCYKGARRPLLDNATLRDSGLSANAKILVVGCTVADLYTIMTPAPEDLKEKPPAVKKEPLCKQAVHKNIIDDGVPEDAIPGILNVNDPLPFEPLKGMLNRHKQKVRLTFKLESDELWISTKEDTDKIKMEVIHAVVSEPIESHEEYHIMGLRVGPAEKLSIWIYIYWVPAQYVQAIKDAILG